MTDIIHNGLKLYTDTDYGNLWHCVDENYDGAPDADEQCMGVGNSEEEAINNYKERARIYYLHEDERIFLDKIFELINLYTKINDESIAHVLQIACDYHKPLQTTEESTK